MISLPRKLFSARWVRLLRSDGVQDKKVEDKKIFNTEITNFHFSNGLKKVNVYFGK